VRIPHPCDVRKRTRGRRREQSSPRLAAKRISNPPPPGVARRPRIPRAPDHPASLARRRAEGAGEEARRGQLPDSIVKQLPVSLVRATPGTRSLRSPHERSDMRGLTSRMSLRSSGLRESGRASSPRVLSGSRARRSSLFLFPPKGRAERQGVSPRPRRHVRAHGLRVLWAHGKTNSHGSGSTPAFRTRMDFAACCMSQGLSLAPTRPRSCELSPGHALGPSARVAGVCPPSARFKDLRSTKASFRVRHRSGHPHPVATSRRQSRRAPYRSGMADRIPDAPAKSTPQEQSPTTIFSENQKNLIRSPDGIGGLQTAVLKNADALHRLWRNPGLTLR
jgi:hypothetical protein